MTNELIWDTVKNDEIWKDVPGYEGLYKISSFGRVISLNYKKQGVEQLLKFGYNRGYKQIYLSKLGKTKTFSIHQLVAIVFLNHVPCGFKLVVDHIDNNPLNNHVSNLQIVSNRKNCSKDKKGSSEYPGVYKIKNNLYRASIRLNGIKYALGTFICEKEAFLQYQKTLDTFNISGKIPEIYKPKSQYKNVIWCKDRNKWRAIGKINGVIQHVGHFKNEVEAFNAFQKIKNQ